MVNALDPQNIKNFSEASVSVEIETEDMTLNIGPQHPSTHGVLRLVAKVDGEKVHDVKPVLGYMHRGYEKLAEVRTYPQITTLVNRIDWVAGFRTQTDYLPYDQFEYEIPVGENGDCYDRWDVRVKEMVESAKIVLQAIDSMPSGPLQAKVPKVIKVPKGRTYVLSLIHI